MKLTEGLKKAIQDESNSYLSAIKETSQYGNLTKEQRDDLGAFYTPASLVIQMLEMFDFKTIEDFAEEDILDPTCGSGNLIMGALIVGSSVDKSYPEKVFGNELAESPLKVCRKRFVDYCKNHGMEKYGEDFWNWHLHQGNTLDVNHISRGSFVEGKSVCLGSILEKTEYEKLSKEEKSQYRAESDNKKGIQTGRYILKTSKSFKLGGRK